MKRSKLLRCALPLALGAVLLTLGTSSGCAPRLNRLRVTLYSLVTTYVGAPRAYVSQVAGALFFYGVEDGMFNNPIGGAVDATHGYYYVADYDNHRVQRFVLSTGAADGWLGTVLAPGGTCTAASGAFTGGWCSGGTSVSGSEDGGLYRPTVVAVDPVGNYLYVGDYYNYRIQRFVLSTGAFAGWLGKIGTVGGTCIAGIGAFTGGWCSGGSGTNGTGDGMFDGPHGLALDRATDSLYVSDFNNGRIQKFTLSTGAFVGWIGRINSTVGMSGACLAAGAGNLTPQWCTGGTGQAGNGNGMMSLPLGVSVDGAGDALYVGDYVNHRVQKFVASTGAFVGWIGRINSTVGMAGACLAAGAGAFTPQWCVGGTAQAGTGDGMFTNPAGVELNVAGDRLYVGDRANNRIQRFTASTGAFGGWIGAIGTVGGTCVAGVGLFTGGWCSGGTPALGTGDGMFNYPYFAIPEPVSDRLIVVDGTNQRVQKMVASTGAFVGASGGSRRLKPDFASAQSSSPISSLGDAVMYAVDVAVDSANGYFYVADYSYGRIQKFMLSTGAFVGWIGRINSTAGMSGACLAAGAGNATPGWCTGGTSQAGTGDGMMSNPTGVALDVTGNILYVADGGNHRLKKFTLSTGAFVGWTGRIGTTAGMAGGCLAAGVGNVTPGWCTGGTAQIGTGDGGLSSPHGVEWDSTSGYLYVADRFNHRIQRFTASTGVAGGWIGNIATTVGMAGACLAAGVGAFTPQWCAGGTGQVGTGDGMLSYPIGLAVDGAGDRLYVIDNTNSRVQRYVRSTGAFSAWIGNIATTGGTCTAGASTASGGWCSGGTSQTGTGDGTFYYPWGIAIDVASNILYVGDYTNHRIARLTLTTGAFVGWIGRAVAAPTGGGTGCTSTVAGNANPTWCTGGRAGIGGGDGMFSRPAGLDYDGSNLYIADSENYRIVRVTLR